jgi:membrane protein implicated in regulation of membrane protease activity
MEILNNAAPFWGWLVLTCLLLAVEAMIAPAGFFLCLGTAAGAMALTTFVLPAISWLWAVSLYSALSVLFCWIWWTFLRKGPDTAEKDALNEKTRQLQGYKGVLEEAIKNGRGRLRINDSDWPVEADRDYPAGTRVKVTAVRGITLTVIEAGQAGEDSGK